LKKNVGQPSGAEELLTRVLDNSLTAKLGELASGVAHELNQPLGAIATFAQAGIRMLDRPEPMVARALDVFKQISGEAINAGEAIRRIRRLFDQDTIVRTRCRVEDVITELLPVLEGLSNQWNGQIEFAPNSASPLLHFDRGKLQHVVYSLVKNGFEAASGVQAPARVRIVVDSDRYGVETSIRDPGPGVPPELQRRLFRPFVTTKSNGTGLGLASCQSILESHHGSIGFENLAGGGCRFWFRLPLPTE
jgi:C4-dicarboxylate-specific signal transduction histidine kinase